MNIFFFGHTSFTAQKLIKEFNLNNNIYFFSRQKKKNNFYFFDLNKRNSKLFKNLKIKKIDYLFYFASFVPFEEKNSDWEKCKKINIYGLVNLLRDINIPIKKFILASSCSVYGSKKNKLFQEHVNLFPENSYSISKLIQEKILQVYCLNNNIEFLCYRIGYVFGKNMNKKRLVKRIMLNYKIGIKNKLYNLNLNLNLIHVDDIAYLIIKTYKKAKGIYNLTNSTQTTLGEYYSILTKKRFTKNNKINNFTSKKLFTEFNNLKKLDFNKKTLSFLNEV